MSNDMHRDTLEVFKRELVSRKLELGQCIQQQEQLETRIAHLQEVAIALARMLGEEYVPEDAIGLTDAIRRAFKTAPTQQFGAIDVRTRLQQMGLDITQYGNLLASIHTVISRLEAKGEIRKTGTTPAGKHVYQWVVRVQR
jgi:hypothetical protein